MQSEGLAQLRKVPLVADGVTYSLCGDFEALIEAEAFFNISRDVNLLIAILNGRDEQFVMAATRQLKCYKSAISPNVAFGVCTRRCLVPACD